MIKENWKLIALTVLTFLQLSRNLSTLNDELNPSLKLLSIGGISLLVLSLLSSLFQLVTTMSAKFQLSRENFKIGACVWLFINVCAALWSFIHSIFLTMLSLSSPTAAGEILLEEKSVETKAGGEEEITAIEEAVTLETEEGTSRAPFLISWILTFAFATLTVLIAMELIKKTREVDQIYKETNARESPAQNQPVGEGKKGISSESAAANDVGYWSDSAPGTSSNTSISEKVTNSPNQFDQSDANSTRQYTEIEEDSFRIQMDARGAKEDLMNRCCIMPGQSQDINNNNNAKYPMPNRVEELKGRNKRQGRLPGHVPEKYEESQQYDWRKSLPRNPTDKRVGGEESGRAPYPDQSKAQKLNPGQQLTTFVNSETLSSNALQSQLDKIKRLEEKLNKALSVPQKVICDSSATISSGSIASEAVDPSNTPSERPDSSNARIYMENHDLKFPTGQLSSASFASSRRSTLNHKKTVRWRNFKEEFEFYGDITVQKRNRPEDKEDA
ncbi:Oidioi.mRNA.OKI2018_I69.PAR.g8840.t1.cds [Oikopleura dioica]|uniref:Oidioi.mRNA.OKI2018_I69.PAR.g8840.t1.cds n=1 Tax=Oikopleura dioica TaxID=34765 RepID=A0ABN7RLF8_OIKDI|nr:Oidioi.mRNA.OKI2018_I69.PAR.g8840.t1.cds [Oikopleura dioica]